MTSAAAPARVTGHPWPRGGNLRGYIATLVILALSAAPGLVAPGSWAYETLRAVRPQAAAWAPRVQEGLLYLLVGTHMLEVLFVALPRLHRHGVPVLSATWCAWVLAWLAAGVYAMQHFDEVTKAQKARVKRK